jgi:hypothetical protein
LAPVLALALALALALLMQAAAAAAAAVAGGDAGTATALCRLPRPHQLWPDVEAARTALLLVPSVAVAGPAGGGSSSRT